ncbi:MAG: NAD-dependent succinate-semialdehyde dehydrogenase [Gammaproteobacteria bacterium]|nr:NAD-dependent succinate-semialdehyde dehydrogenase [Gammaproteobacteria bacterium]
MQNASLIKTASYINGEWQSDAERQFAVTNPANGREIIQVQNATATDAKAAIDAAERALPDWRKKTAKQRANILRRWFELMLQHQDELASILTAEQGKPLAEAKGEIAYGANYVEWFAEEAKRVYGDTIPQANSDSRIVVIKQAVGVVTAITPWNFPNAMIARKAAPALAAGCTFVVKAAGETPLSALAMAQLAEQAGIPAGVFNVLASDNAKPIGEVLTTDPRVAKFSFTGSTAVGKTLLKQCASTVKRTTMELGGNAPFIVFADADLDKAVSGLIASKFRNAGQTCVCSNRIFVQSDVYEAFTKKLLEAVKDLNVGEGTQAGVTIGPLITQDALDGVDQLVKQAVHDGAQLEVGGEGHDLGGLFYQPTVLSQVTPDMAVAREEIFGPVAPLIKFETEADVIRLANDTNVGLASYMYSRDIGTIWRVAEALEFGMVGINTGAISNEMAPFGGVKESGMGREGSKYGIEDYLEIKYLCMAGISDEN